MAKVITMKDEIKSVESSKKILESSGALRFIIPSAKKGKDVTVRYSSLSTDGTAAYRAAVGVVDAHGGNGKKEVTYNHGKGSFTVSGNGCIIIDNSYHPNVM